MKKGLLFLLALCAIWMSTAHAGINFGGRESAIDVGSGGTLTLGTSKSLSDGVLRDSGGTITATTATCSNMVIEVADGTTTKSMKTDGSITIGGTPVLTLGANELLSVDGGQLDQDVSVTSAVATPAIIQGHGSFDAAISVSGDAAAAGLIMRWQGGLNQNISMDTDTNAVTLTLENDLHFINGAKPTATSATATGKVAFGGYKMYLGGGSTGTLTIGAIAQTWEDAKLVLEGDVTVSATLTLAQSGSDTISIEGNGHKMTVSGALVDSGINATVTDVYFNTYSTGPFNGSTGNWTLRNCILDTGTEAIRVIDGVLAGATDDVFSGSSTWPTQTHLELLKDFTLEATMTFDDGTNGSTINGNGNTLLFDDSSSILHFDAALTLTDIELRDVITNSIDNTQGQDLHLSNVVWHDAAFAGTVRINPTSKVADRKYAQLSLGATGTDGLLYNTSVTWNNGASLELLSNTTIAGTSTWTFTNISEIRGNGHVLNLNAGILDYDDDLYLSNIILGDLADASLNQASGKHLYMSNVTLIDNTTEGAVRVNASTSGTSGVAAAAQALLTATSGAVGNVFAQDIDWVNGVNLDLLADISLTGSWKFSENSEINGHGHVIDLGAAAALNIGEAKTLTISNAVIKGWDATNDIDFVNGDGTLALSNVTIILAGTISALGASEKIHVNGPLTIVTGAYIFDASAANTNNQINGVTIWYDTLGGNDASNVNFGANPSGTPSGQVAMLPISDTTGETEYSDSSPHVNQSLFLSYDIDVSNDDSYEALGKRVKLNNTSAGFTLRGNGRTFYMAPRTLSSDTTMDPDTYDAKRLMYVSGSDSNIIEIHDLTFDGWSEDHIKDADEMLRYCTGTVIRLQSDQSLTTPLHFATATESGNVTIDLNGFNLDMSDNGASLNIANVATTLTIKNGRLINFNDTNLSGPKIVAAGTNPTVVFQDVEFVIADNTPEDGTLTIGDFNVVFKGNCTVTGTSDYTLDFKYTDVTIASGAMLTIDKTMTLKFTGTTANDPTLTFSSANSTLSLIGSILDTQSINGSSITFQTGTLRIDDKVQFNLGSGKTLNLGGAGANDLDIDIMPAARVVVNSGTVSYDNAS